MQSITSALHQKRHALLESPTGTGQAIQVYALRSRALPALLLPVRSCLVVVLMLLLYHMEYLHCLAKSTHVTVPRCHVSLS